MVPRGTTVSYARVPRQVSGALHSLLEQEFGGELDCSPSLFVSFLIRSPLSRRQLHFFRDLAIDLDAFFVLREVAEHLGIVFQPTYLCGEQLIEPTGIERFSLDQIVHSAHEVSARGIDGSNHHFVAKHESLVDFICMYFDFLLATRHTR